MKVLITTDWYTSVINGVVASVQVLSRELTKRGHEVRILTLSENRHSYINEEVFYAGSAGIGRLYPGARIKLPGTGWGMKELLHWRPDIIHSQCECSTFILAKRIAAELKIPIIHTCHTIYEDYTHYFSPREKWGREIVQRITRRISRQVSGMIVPSEKVRKILENYQVACPLWVIPSGIDLSGFETQENEKWREEIRKKYSISSKETVILYVGRLAKEKNVKELLQYQQKKKEGKEVLMLVGDGPYRRELEEYVRAHYLENRVVFTGMICHEKVHRYYQAGDLFVSASVSETQGLTYGEALASGLPLLCRKDDCLKGVVEEGVNGWQYENDNEFFDCLEKWEKMKKSRKEKMCKMARESAHQFSAENFGREVEKVYEMGLENFFPGRSGNMYRSGNMGI